MKRFTETEKWRDPWFINLSGHAKLLWVYLTENCDKIGLIHIDFRLVTRDCRLPINEKHITELGDRVQALSKGRYFLPKFVAFQYGELSPDCHPHRSILKLIQLHNLTRVGMAYRYPTVTLLATPPPTAEEKKGPEGNGSDKTGSGPEGGAGGNQPPAPPLPPAHEILQFLNAQTGRDFRPTETNIKFIENRLAENGVTVDGVKIMIVRQCNRWLRTDQSEYLRPETLFNKTKFDGYYAAKDQPLHETNQRNPAGGHRPATGAEHRQTGIPKQPDDDLGKLLARREERTAPPVPPANGVAAPPPAPECGDAGSPGNE